MYICIVRIYERIKLILKLTIMSFVARFMQSFRNIKTDAVPQPPRVTIEDGSEEEQSSVVEPTNNPHVGPQTLPKLKTKKTKKKTKDSTEPKKSSIDGEPFETIRTQATGNVINVIHSPGSHVGTNITYNIGSFKKEEKTENNELSIKKTKSVRALLVSSDEVQPQYISHLSKNIGTGWRDIFRSFGLSEGFMDLTYEDNIHKGVSEVIYQLILDWVRNQKGTLGELSTLLWKKGKRSVVVEMAALYENEKIEESVDKIKKTY